MLSAETSPMIAASTTSTHGAQRRHPFDLTSLVATADTLVLLPVPRPRPTKDSRLRRARASSSEDDARARRRRESLVGRGRGTGRRTRVSAVATKDVRSKGWRRWAPWVLVVLAAIIGLVSALNIWVKRQALSDENWANASSKLLENDEIRNAISVYIVDQIYANVDVSQQL